MLTTEVTAAAEDYQRHKEHCVGHVVGPRVPAHKVFGISNKGEDSNKGESDEQLSCED